MFAAARSLLRREWVQLTLLAAAVLIPRLLFLDADPPSGFHFHFVNDEGAYAHNARVHALFGRWIWDDHNPVYTASAHTFLLRSLYAVVGVGLWQTRLLSALAGALTCFLVYGFVRREASRSVAFLSTLILSVDAFFVSHNRVGFTESLQLLFITVAVFAALRSRCVPAWAAVSALSLVAALMSKPTSLPAVAVLAIWYVTAALRTQPSSEERAALLRSVRMFAGFGALAVVIVGVTLVLPQWEEVRAEFGNAAAVASGGDSALPVVRRLLWYGTRYDLGGIYVLGGFFAQEWALLAGVSLLAVSRLLRVDQRPLGSPEVCCWVWLATMLASLATHHSYAPDRRYLLHVPPLAILVALAATGERAADKQEHQARPVQTSRWIAAWLVATLAIGVYLRPLALSVLTQAASELPIGKEPGLSASVSVALGWFIASLLAAAGVTAWNRFGRSGLVRGAALAAALLSITLGTMRLAAQARQPCFAMRDASRDLARLARTLPPGRRVAVGTTSETLGLETDLFCFMVRNWPDQRVFLNLDGLHRFRPALAIVTEGGGKRVGHPEGFSTDGMRPVRLYEFWPDSDGRPQLRTTVYATGSAVQR